MKKTLILSIMLTIGWLALPQSVFAQLSGTYTINPGGSGGRNYTTFAGAVSALSSGVNGAVTFDVSASTFTEQVAIGSISGVSSTNTVTFKGAGASSTKLTYASSSSSARHTLKLTGCDWVNFEGMTIEATGSSYQWAVQVMSTTGGTMTTDCKFEKCIITVDANNSSNYVAVVLNNSTSSYTSGGSAERITFDGCTIKKGYLGVVSRGSSSSLRMKDITIRNCELLDQGYYGLYFYYCENSIIEKNRIELNKTYTNYCFGIYFYYQSASTGYKFKVNDNIISGNGARGIYCYDVDGNSSLHSEINNNVVQGDFRNTTYTYPLYIDNASYLNIYHNSMATNVSYSNSYGVLTLSNSTDLNVKNNTLIGYGLNPPLYYFNSSGSPTTTNVSIDYNNLYSYDNQSNILIYEYSGSSYSAYYPSTYKNFVGSNCVNASQGWGSISNLAIADGCVNGVTGLGITKDVLDSNRNTPPDMGAYEAVSAGYDAGVQAISSPSIPTTGGSKSVTINIKNFGSTSIDSIQCGYQFNGGTPVIQTFVLTSSLGACDTISLTFTTPVNISSCSLLKTWTSKINNNQTDLEATNDTLTISIGVAVSGIKTVGGTSPDFATLNSALNGLNCGGINGPIRLMVRPGTYLGQQSFPTILGMSSTNTITIESSTGVASDVVFTSTGVAINDKHTFQLSGVSNYTFRNITVENKGTSYGYGIHILNGCSDINITNCTVLGASGNSSSYVSNIVVNGGDYYYNGGQNYKIAIDSCTLTGTGYYGNVILYGSSSAAYGEENSVKNSDLSGGYYYGGVYSYYQTGMVIDNNTISGITNGYGIYAYWNQPYNGKAALKVTNNRFFNCYTGGMYLSSCDGTSSDPTLIVNNQIGSGYGSSTTYGIYASSTDYVNCFHNTVFMKGGTGTTYGLNNTSGTYWDIENNHFTIDASATTAGYAMYLNSNTGHTIDYNNYLNPNGNNLIYRSATYTSSTYQTSTAGGANSSNTDVNFLDATNLDLLSGCAPRGTPITSVTTDRYGNTRSTSAPFIGAHEATQYSADAGVIEILAPSNPVNTSSSYDVKLVVKNFGTTTITSLEVGYDLNGSPVSTTIGSLNIASCDTAHITLTGTMQVMFGAGVNNLRGFTGRINGTTVDAEHANDTSDGYQYCGAMSGAFTINPAGSGTTNFINFNKAVSALNTCGMGGPVTITVSAGTYNEQVVITNPISGGSATNWLTFDGVDPLTRIVSFNGTSTSSGAAIELLGTKYITIQNLGVKNMGTSYAMGIRIANFSTAPSDSVTIKGCIIDVPTYNGSVSSYWIGIGITPQKYYITSNSSGYVAKNITIEGNAVNGGYYGCGSYGTSSYYHEGFSIINNTFNNQYYYPIYAYYYHNNLLIDNNKVNNPGVGVNTFSYAIRSYYNDNVRITRNQICNQYGGYGIYSFYDEGSGTAQSLIANNTVNINAEGTTNTMYGIYVYNPTYMDVVYNSCFLNGNSTTGNALYLYFSSTSYASNNILNNNLVNTGPGYSVYYNAANNTTFQTCVNSLNNNNYFSNGTYPLRFINNIFPLSGMSTWSSSSFAGASNDTKTLTIDPDYSSSCMLSTLSLDIDSAGTPLSNVTTDINGNTRNATHPDIGAYEFDGPNFNIKVVSIAAPNAPASAGAADVKVVIQNAGYATITSANIHYKVNATGTPKTIAYSGNLPFGGIDTITFSGSNAYTVVSGVKDLLIAFSDSPNGSADQDTKNDTVSKFVCEALSGLYTVNGTGTKNYADLMTAAEALNGCGVSAAVTFNVNPGVYNGRLVLNDILGSSATNNVVFQGSTNVASDVNVTYTSTSSTDNGVVILNSTDYITFRNMSFYNNGSTYGQVFVFKGSGADGSDNNTIDSCIVRGSALSTTSNNTALIYSYSQLSLYNRIANSNLLYGSYGLYAYGNPIIGAFGNNWTVFNNTIDSQYYSGLYFQFSENLNIQNNTILHNVSYTGRQGIYCNNNEGASVISGNNIAFSSNASYGFYFAGHNTYYRTDTALIYNNFISQPGGSYCAYLYGNTQMAIFNNNINMLSGSYAVYMPINATPNDIMFFNNNINSGASYALYISGSAPTLCDNNNYNASSILGYYNGSYSNLAAWKGALYTGSDANSFAVNPNFVSANDLHCTAEVLVGAALAVGLDVDIDGDARHMTTPVIGADEYIADVQLASVSGPAAAACNRTSETVTVKLRNVGQSIISNIGLAMQVNGGTAVNETFTGTINPGDSADYTFTAKADLSTVGSNTIMVTSSRSIDYNTANNMASLTVLHADSPVANFTHKDTCFGGTVMFTNTSSVAHGSLSSYAWDFDNTNTSTATNPTEAFAGVGPYNVKLTASSSYGCTGNVTIPVNILTELEAGDIAGTQTICYNSTPAGLTNTTGASGSGTTYNYQWQMSTNGTSFSDISGATTSTYQPSALTATTWYRRGVTTNLGCGPKYSSAIKVTVYDQLVAGTITGAQTICYNTTPAQINGATNPTGGDGSFTHKWESSSNGSNWFTITGASGVNYAPAKLTSTTYFRRTDIGGSSCGEKVTNIIKVTVYDDVTAGTFANNYDICPNTSPGTISQTSGATGGDGTYTYQWQMSTDNINWSNIGGASGISFTPGSLTNTTYYRREATSGSSCGSIISASISVDVRTLPTASFTTSSHCIGDKVPLVNTSTPGFGTLTGFFWDFGNGASSSANTPNYTYPTGGNKTIKLVVTNNIGCKDSTTRTANISNIPNAAFNYIYDCSTDSILFKNTTSINCGVINAFSWNFGDGGSSSIENPVHKYASSGTYQITYVIYLSGGLTDTTLRNITIYPKGNVDFTAPDVCYNDVSKFTNTSSNAGSYLWKFGDNATSNAANPNHLYATSNSYQVTLQAVSLNGCNFSLTKTHIVKVRPDADIVSGNRCLGDTLPFGNGSIYAHNYNWDFGDGTSSTLATPMKLYTAAGTYSVKLVATNNNGCVDSTTSSATIYSLPVANFTVNNTCFGNDINFTNTSTGYASSAWNMGDGSSSATTNPVYRYATMGTYTVGLQVTSGFGCKNSTSKTVTVYPKPSVSFTTSNVCSGTAANFTNTSSISSGSVTYNWNFGDGNSSTSTSPSNTYAAAGVYNVKLVGSSGFGCSDSVTNTISIYTAAIADFSSSNSCLGTATNFSNMSQNATSYAWDFGDGRTSTQANPSNTYASVGTYTVKLTANNGNNCSSVVSKTIQVNALPSVSFTGNNVCQGTATTFTNSTTGATSYSWDFGDGSSSTLATPTRTYGTAGTYTVRLTATSGSNCSSVGTRTVQVYANPIAGFNASSVCAGTSLQFVNTSSGAATYAWDFGDATTSTSANPSKTYGTSGTYTVTLTVTSSNNCTNVIAKQVVIYATPVADFSNTTECQGVATVFTNSSTGATSYNWTFGDGNASTTTSPSYMYGNAGTYNVTLVANNSNGCKNQITKSVTVNSKPAAGFTASNICLGSAVNFTNSTTGATSYNWSFGDATTSNSASPSKTYAAAGVYNVTLTATNANNCSSVISKQVSVYANPTAGFSATEECIGKTSVFTNSSTGAVLYSWNFGDGTTSPLTNPTKAYSTAGAYTVTLTATNSNNCSNVTSKTVNAFANPTANFTSSVVCTDNTTQLTNTSTGGTSYSWSFGDGGTSTATSPSKTYAAAGTYVVTLTSSTGNNCKATVQNTVVVSPAPVASFSANEVCLGAATQFNNTTSNATSASWTFGDATSSTQLFPSHTYGSASSYTVNLNVMSGNGCTSNASKTVVVNANPIANFTASNACQGTTVNISNTSSGADSYEWYYGLMGPDKVMTPNVSLNNVGTTTIRLVAMTDKGCKSETSKNIDIYSKPIASFEVLNTCAGDQTRFVNKSLSSGSYNWQFGDGDNSGNSNPSHQYAAAGSYNVTLTANNAQCSDVVTKSVVVNALPSSNFTFGTSGKDVLYTSSNKTNVTSYGWNFGDGSTGTNADPKHTYNNAVVTVYNVCLTVVDNQGCQSETCKPVSINLVSNQEITMNQGVVVYPNPNQGSFKVKVGASQDRAEVAVYNLLGVKVADAKSIGNDEYGVNATELSAGSYMVKVIYEGKTSVHNVVITR